MARKRMLSQELIYDEEFNSLSLESQNLFVRMLAVSDDYGVLPCSEYSLKTLTNPPTSIAKKIMFYVEEIVNKNLGTIFDYENKSYFIFKKESFERINSYLLGKRTKSEYLRLEKEFMESDKFLEILGNSRQVGSTSIVSNKYKDISKKKKDIQESKHPLCLYISSTLPAVAQMKNQLTDEQAEKLVKEFDDRLIKEVLDAMENFNGLAKKYSSVNLTLRNWIKIRLNGRGASAIKPSRPSAEMSSDMQMIKNKIAEGQKNIVL